MAFNFSNVQARTVGFPEKDYTFLLEAVSSDTTSKGNPRVKIKFRLVGNEKYDNRVLFEDLVLTEKTLPYVKGNFEAITGKSLDRDFPDETSAIRYIVTEIKKSTNNTFIARLGEVDGQLKAKSAYKRA